MEIPKPKQRRRRRVRKAVDKAKQGAARVPPLSSNPATNLLIADIAMRGAGMLVGRIVEKAALATRYHPDKAKDIVSGRTFAQSMLSNGAARVATRSVPGFLLVGGGLLAKAIFDRTFSRGESARRGDRALAEQADKASDS